MSEQNEPFQDWDGIRVAYHVARLGTLSAAATFLGVHHATVIRRIDMLEAVLGTKLFQRHPRGYTPTEAGQALMKTAAIAEDQLTQLAGRLQGAGSAIGGDLIITTLDGFSAWVTPLIAEFQALHPDVRVTLATDQRLYKLEHGEAHVAIRAGPKPQEPGNVVQHLGRFKTTMYAHQDYVARYGPLRGPHDIGHHRFIGGEKNRPYSPMDRWMNANIPDGAIVFRSSNLRAQSDALLAGIGIGFWANVPRLRELVQMCPPQEDWRGDLWLVTHVDLHRSTKVNAVSKFLTRRIAQLHAETA